MKKLAAAALLSLAAAAPAAVYTAPGGAITDGTPIDYSVTYFPLTITGQSTVVSAVNSVTLTGLNHTYLGDLTAVLVAPDDNVFTFFFAAPESFDMNLNGTYTFAVSAAQTIAQAAAPLSDTQTVPSGTYAPNDYDTGNGNNTNLRTNFNNFVGQTVNGEWGLFVYDFFDGDEGSFTSWTLNLSEAPVPEPTSLSLLGLGSLALLRRRR